MEQYCVLQIHVNIYSNIAQYEPYKDIRNHAAQKEPYVNILNNIAHYKPIC